VPRAEPAAARAWTYPYESAERVVGFQFSQLSIANL
jgi:hypothetical protein